MHHSDYGMLPRSAVLFFVHVGAAVWSALDSGVACVPDLDLGLCNKEGQGYGELASLSGNADAIRALLEGA